MNDPDSDATRQLLAAFTSRALAAKRDFVQLLKAPMREQERLLLEDCIRPNVDTEFGKQHDFASVNSIDDFRARVPVRSYDELAPWFERAAEGVPGVLTRDPPVAFNRTSGTTGRSKVIPVTDNYRRNHEVRRQLIFWGNLLEFHPEVNERADTTLNLVFDPRPPTNQTAAGAPYAPLSSRVSPLHGGPGSLAPWTAVPAEITDHAERLYVRARLAVEHDLRCVTAFTPSTLVFLAESLAGWIDRLEQDLIAGTIAGRAGGVPNPARARELRALADRHGVLLPRHVWPRVTTIPCSKSAGMGLYMPQLLRLYGDHVDLLPLSVGASEGMITQVVDRHPTAGFPAVYSSLLEFRRVDGNDADGASTLLLDELREGTEYEVILTQPAGVYRYAIGDVFRVVELVAGVPRLELIGRKGAQSSFTGEKLTEHHVVVSIQAALRTRGIELPHIACCPVWGEPPFYVFAIEGELVGENLELLAAELDRQLMVNNEAYETYRLKKALDPARVVRVQTGTFEALGARQIATGASAVQMKHKWLETDVARVSALLAGALDGGP